ncbi:MAG: hypothetical protein JSR33_01125 [Proteobacteria bacterium]|nr:hypothetical protein [Pseudomonadota bacterium]
MRQLEFVNNREKWLMRWKLGAPNSRVTDIAAFKVITKLSKQASILGNILVIIELCFDGVNVFETYEDGGNWYKELFKVIIEFELSFFGSQFGKYIALCLLPEVGWVCILLRVGGALAIPGGILDSACWVNHKIENYIREHKK